MESRPINDISYEAYLAEDKLMGTRCRSCGALYCPPRPLCTECHETAMDWEEIRGEGKLVSFTSIAVGPPSMKEEGFDRNHPYCLGVVELDRGGRVVARILGVDPRHPEVIHIGMRLRSRLLHRSVGGKAKTVLAFEPA